MLLFAAGAWVVWIVGLAMVAAVAAVVLPFTFAIGPLVLLVALVWYWASRRERRDPSKIILEQSGPTAASPGAGAGAGGAGAASSDK